MVLYGYPANNLRGISSLNDSYGCHVYFDFAGNDNQQSHGINRNVSAQTTSIPV